MVVCVAKLQGTVVFLLLAHISPYEWPPLHFDAFWIILKDSCVQVHAKKLPPTMIPLVASVNL